MKRRSVLRNTLALGLAAATGSTAAVLASSGPAGAIPAGTDHVILWNEALRYAFSRTDFAPGPLTRWAAVLNAAIYDTVVSLQGNATPYLGRVSREPNYNYDVVSNIDAAARTVLPRIFPTVDFTAFYTEAAKYRPVGNPGPEGWSTSVGVTAAQRILAARANDNSNDDTPYADGTEPGQWRQTGSGPAATPNWGGVTPFTLGSGTQFRPPPPGGFSSLPALLASLEYAAQLNEVKSLGAVNSTTRTAEQTKIAFFWANDVAGTYKPPGQLLRHTSILALERNLDSFQAARLYTLVTLAMADAAIVSWDAKFRTPIDLWRPESAIRLADTDGNPATVADPDWQPLSVNRSGVRFSPPFPAYTSGHATLAGAWAGVMKRYFGTDNVTFRVDSVDPNEQQYRTYTSFSSAAAENARSRVYLGVHYQWDADLGMSSGDAVAGQAFARLS
ncbi:vanadium-dependent haloperoxidase [Paractinoplanes hotanensis]|uniref:Vanadium-dependent haloperoxidase n=1 Tax=Paractinoplanes hotanensis TaxID=2906497 RepID=A0ABT0XRX9_9ACTN|nr:vanadium-dependent haloperoxidase [Actinoplanes hotanensis]MCM4076523.1 vanadium-dependent haloperoxidase [Actinoplanes hotanensis]